MCPRCGRPASAYLFKRGARWYVVYRHTARLSHTVSPLPKHQALIDIVEFGAVPLAYLERRYGPEAAGWAVERAKELGAVVIE